MSISMAERQFTLDVEIPLLDVSVLSCVGIVADDSKHSGRSAREGSIPRKITNDARIWIPPVPRRFITDVRRDLVLLAKAAVCPQGTPDQPLPLRPR
jgi:hypothetical protein